MAPATRSRRNARAFLAAFLVLVACFVGASSARADAADTARSAAARAAFEEGVKKADVRAWAEAADLFQRALALRDSPVIRFNLGAALGELGKLVEASELFRALEIDARAPTELRERARGEGEALRARLARLTVHVHAVPAAASVLLDARVLSPAELGVAMPVDPGTHQLSVRRAELELHAEQLTLAEGEARQLYLSVEEPAPELAPTAAIAVAAPGPRLALAPPVRGDDVPRSSNEDRRRRRLWWGLGGAAVVVAAGVLAGVALASRSAAQPHGDFDPPTVGVQVPQ